MSQSIIERLGLRHADAVFIGECAMGSRQNGCRRLDAWVLLKTWSPWTTIGYEIKGSRSDFLQDRKWQSYLPVCHEFYFACPAKLIAPEELPQDVGLLWTLGESRLVTKRRAVRREPDAAALVELMCYALMSRTRIVGDMWEAQSRETKEQFWRRWLAEGAAGKDLAHQVSRRIRERLAEAERGRRQAEDDRKRLEHVAEHLESLGISRDATSWQIDQALADRLGRVKLDRIARLAELIKELTALPQEGRKGAR